ncbi:MAG: hypothetical protein FJ098_13160 [Deltaproteobacteria bacterium]|nr:hypothetical protein [Deltaproteobacteria bacterium]
MVRGPALLPLVAIACVAVPEPALETREAVALEEGGLTVHLLLSAAYEDLQPQPDGSLDAATRPIRGALIEVLGPGGLLLAHGALDATGTAELTFEASPGLPLRVRVLALTAQRFLSVAVRSGSYAIHALESPVVPADGSMVLSLLATADSAGPAFNLFDAVSAAARELAVRYGPLPGLDVVWSAGLSHPCGSCYLPFAAAILVGGGETDPDHWDDSVVLHELGHWFEDSLSASTSPGGAHDGTPTWPDLAWSEGFASAFGQGFLGSPVYVDSLADSAWSMDLERMGGSHAWGTEGGHLEDDVSENLVAAVLWDLQDDGAEPHDALAAGLLRILDPAVAWLGREDRPDVGFPGVDLADYLTGWFTTGAGRWWEVADIVLARDYPYPFHAPPLALP